ncbi:NAD(P)H-dependent oxidoreductase [Pseudomonas sp. RP23018S]|uniref:NADPH-dependent FMN reductase n=1 Tax=Pseudomonas sp. RP23018S TaxID=3096037 RepID=UPI002ACA1C17|nr:NAD(P)H-dependent oxidoreductase [Pseudomonas sp. RP23018S]MDZ5601927.1 NAD(P)H-dependent oxidoreductase [Pseudomonas sp. RP23018S]
MSHEYSVAVVVGSLRKDSYNRKVAQALSELAPSSLSLKIVEIGDLALYNEDVEANAPEAWKRFRDEIRHSDAVLFVTPEYNRTMPGCLKNAIDVGSRPYGESAWNGKPAAVVSVSPSALGGFGANHAVRQALVFLDMPCMQMPEAYVGNAANLFDEAGKLNDKTRPFLQSFIDRFAGWVKLNRSV